MARNTFTRVVAGIFCVLLCFSETWAGTGTAQPEKPGPENPYSLTISGGISLGVYEAGLNAVIVNALKDGYLNSDEKNFRLDTVTGASAGAINALISAISFCEYYKPGKNAEQNIFRNLYRDTWEKADVKDFLPQDAVDYDQLKLDLGKEKDRLLKDSLFSRKVFKEILNNIRKRIDEGHFRDKLEVKMAFMVTRSTPLATNIDTTPESQKIYSQRFVIPLIVQTQPVTQNGVSRVGLFFKNNKEYVSSNGKNMEYLLLPESDGYVEFDQVARAVLASSAFPLAFSRVQLAYCEPATHADFPDESGTCPKGYKASSGFFSDGGTFDNVPLGVAVELVEQVKRRPATYIYMDPANRRSVTHLSDDTKEDEGSLVLTEQVKAWVPAFGTLMNGELYRTLIGQFSGDRNRDRELLLTRRFPPVTGNFLGHFGAFLDPSFRIYDYSAGVYDGLMNVTDYLFYLRAEECRDAKDKSDCAADKKADIFYKLVKQHIDFTTATDQEMYQLLKSFLEWEKTSPAWNKVKDLFPKTQIASASYDVYKALTRVGESEFQSFLAELKPNEKQFATQTREMINNPDYWGILLGRRAINRLVDIEEDQDGGLLRLLKVSAVVANAQKIKDNKTTWSLSSAPRRKWWYRLVPDAIEVDGAQTGIALSYLLSPEKLITKWGYFEWQVASAHIQIKEVDNERLQYWSFGGAWRKPIDNAAFSSFGLGAYPNQNFGNSGKFGKKLLWGGEVSFGLLADKLRITIGTRDLISDYPGEDWTVRFGFTDIDAWLSLL